MTITLSIAVLALCAVISTAGHAAETAAPPDTPAPAPWRLLFSSQKDLDDTWGQLHIAVTPIRQLREAENPGMAYVAGFPLPDGSWEVFATQLTELDHGNGQWTRRVDWKLIRATTRDGVTFENPTTVFEAPTAAWTDHITLARNGDTGEYLLLKLKVDDSGFAYTAFFSPDGRHWTAHPGNPLFYDGDAISLFWSQKLRRFVCINKGLQPYRKRIRDHGGTTPALHDDALRDRRVLMMRSSPDGRRWDPEVNISDVWNVHGHKAAVPDRYLTVPDAQDPPDLEFYSGNAFWYHDRAYMMVLNYAASPAMPGKHAPHLDNEWWTSPDGLRWERPAREVNALEVFPQIPRLETPPMAIAGSLVWPRAHLLVGLPEDRISGVAARANAEFSTHPFTMPAGDLVVNAAVPSPERPFGKAQAYLMASLLDEKGAVIPGCEPEKCVVTGEDRRDIPLRWAAASARALAGRTVRLRFYLRCATVYAVRAGG